MYTNNTLDIGLMWERDKIGTTQKMQPVWPHFCLGGREGEGGKQRPSTRNEAISAAFFVLGMGWGLDRYPNIKNAAQLAVFFVSG